MGVLKAGLLPDELSERDGINFLVWVEGGVGISGKWLCWSPWAGRGQSCRFWERWMPVCVDLSCEIEPQREWGLGPWSFDLGSLSRGNLRSASSKGNGVPVGHFTSKYNPICGRKGSGWGLTSTWRSNFRQQRGSELKSSMWDRNGDGVRGLNGTCSLSNGWFYTCEFHFT